MQQWEYLLVFRGRGYFDRGTTNLHTPRPFETDVNGQMTDIDMDQYLNKLGAEGWELVAVVAESSLAGGVTGTEYYSDVAGFTTTEKWIFKRPK